MLTFGTMFALKTQNHPRSRAIASRGMLSAAAAGL